MDSSIASKPPLSLVYAANRDFLPFALVSMVSAIRSQTRWCHLHLIHDGDIDQEYQERVRRFIDQQGASIDFHSVPVSFPREFAKHTKWDVSVLFRLAMTQIVPSNLQRVVYIDADTIVRRPIDEMFEIELGETGLGAIPESHAAVQRLGLDKDSAYLNSGILAIDLDTWRSNETCEQMMQLVMQDPERWVFPDQDILAAHFNGRWRRLPPEFNVTHRFFSGPDALPLPTDDPFIIHFTGRGLKPWQTHQPHPFADEFWTLASAVQKAGFEIPPRPQRPTRWYQRGPVRAYRNRRQERRAVRRQQEESARRERRAGIQSKGRQMVETYAPDLIVRRGPFVGMKYAQAYSHGSTLAPKLLGTYEAELQPIVNKLMRKDYPRIIDVGGAEGYYAIGCAMRWPEAQVVAYELQREAREAIAEMASANSVRDRVDIQAECMFGDLYGQRALVICDIEGCEAELLVHDDASEGFAAADFLIETHDLFRPGICERLREQFSATHDVTVVDAILDEDRPRYWQIPELSGLSNEEQSEVIGERRGGPMQWLVCESRRPFEQRDLDVSRAA